MYRVFAVVVNLTITHLPNTHIMCSAAGGSVIAVFEQGRENTLGLSQRTSFGFPCSDLCVARMQLPSQHCGMLFKHMPQPHLPYKDSLVKPCFGFLCVFFFF